MNLNFPNESDSYKDEDCYESRKSNKYDCDESREYESKKSRSRSRYYNSRSRYYDESRKYGSKEKGSRKCEMCCCCEKKVKPCPPMKFETCCGSTTDVPQTVDTAGAQFQFHSPISLACLSLDTECLKDPKVLLQFECQIYIRFSAAQTNPAKVNFELIRTDGCKETSCGSWTFSHRIGAHETNDEITEQFSFDKIDCGNCSECTTYSVRLVNPINNGQQVSLFQIQNPTLTAFAKSC